jgi:hypothetical protein
VYDRLANSFGSENVFLDVQDVQPGMNWLEEIKSHRASSDVLLSLIGPHWVSIMRAREHAAVAGPAEDYVRFEIEYVLRPTSRIWVIPVLVGEMMPLSTGHLPRPLQALAKIQAAQVRQERFADDIADLISRIEAIARHSLASATFDGTVRLWDVATGRPIGNPLAGHGGASGAVSAVAFSPDGKTLATSSQDGLVRLWDVATGRQIGNPLGGQSSAVGAVAFSPDGKTLAAGIVDTVRLWHVAYLVDIVPQLCASAGRSLTVAEWARYVPPGPAYRKVCP